MTFSRPHSAKDGLGAFELAVKAGQEKAGDPENAASVRAGAGDNDDLWYAHMRRS